MKNVSLLLIFLLTQLFILSCSAAFLSDTTASESAAVPKEHFLVTQPSDTPSAFDDILEALRWRDSQCLLHQTGFDKTAVVRDYFSGDKIPVKDAFYVKGSSIVTPSGGDIISFADRDTAVRFMRDHGGKIVTYDQIISLTFE